MSSNAQQAAAATAVAGAPHPSPAEEATHTGGHTRVHGCAPAVETWLQHALKVCPEVVQGRNQPCQQPPCHPALVACHTHSPEQVGQPRVSKRGGHARGDTSLGELQETAARILHVQPPCAGAPQRTLLPPASCEALWPLLSSQESLPCLLNLAPPC